MHNLKSQEALKNEYLQYGTSERNKIRPGWVALVGWSDNDEELYKEEGSSLGP